MSNNAPESTVNAYKPAVKHWFYRKKGVWVPFSFIDSALIEEAFLSGDENRYLVAVENGRYDVNISNRTKSSAYWKGEPIEVRRCSWFFKADNSKFAPYEESIADILEEEYKKASESGEWHKKIPISTTDHVVLDGPKIIYQYQQNQEADSWGGSTFDKEKIASFIQQPKLLRSRVVKRDIEGFSIEEGESHTDKIDHLLFMLNGIGPICDLWMRSVEEVVDEFRSIALQLIHSHYRNSVENGSVGRVEVFPVSWHEELRSDEFGLDEKLKAITLKSIPMFRNFAHDVLLDILLYTGSMFTQRILDIVVTSMNSVYTKYKQRHPDFQGGISLAGISLGSLILFDILCHQKPLEESEEPNLEERSQTGKHISTTEQSSSTYPQLLFQPKRCFALGSPIGLFVTVRGIDKFGLDFRLPTCPEFYNIFHPYDPVAYRIEALINPDMSGIPPVVIPHHKGRKRMHLKLIDAMARVGSDLRQRFYETLKSIENVSLISSRLESDRQEIEKEAEEVRQEQEEQASTSKSSDDLNSPNQSDKVVTQIDFPLGKLNNGKRVDYALQEGPLEFFNDYLFAFSSHLCYWESEDTILFVMKEIYNGIGISPDSPRSSSEESQSVSSKKEVSDSSV